MYCNRQIQNLCIFRTLILDSVSNNSFFENNKILINHILLIFKLYVYKSREKKFININNLIAEIRKVKRIEKEIALNNSMKTRKQLLLEIMAFNR